MEKNTIYGVVVTTDNPKNLLTKAEEWDKLLSQFSNLEKVKITITSAE